MISKQARRWYHHLNPPLARAGETRQIVAVAAEKVHRRQLEGRAGEVALGALENLRPRRKVVDLFAHPRRVLLQLPNLALVVVDEAVELL